MCSGKSYHAPAPKPLPDAPRLAEAGQAAPVIDDGFGLTQKLADLRNSNPLLIPFRNRGGPTTPTLGKVYGARADGRWGNAPAPGTGFTLANGKLGGSNRGFVAGSNAQFSTDYLKQNKIGGY